MAGRLRQAQAALVWPEVAGAELARHTRAMEVRGGTLWVAVRSSAWAAQLSFLRTDLLAALNRRIGDPGVKGLHFRVDAVQAPPPAEQAAPGPAPGSHRPSAADATVIEEAAERVGDSEMRRAWRRALVAAVVRRRRLGG